MTKGIPYPITSLSWLRYRLWRFQLPCLYQFRIRRKDRSSCWRSESQSQSRSQARALRELPSFKIWRKGSKHENPKVRFQATKVCSLTTYKYFLYILHILREHADVNFPDLMRGMKYLRIQFSSNVGKIPLPYLFIKKLQLTQFLEARKFMSIFKQLSSEEVDLGV